MSDFWFLTIVSNSWICVEQESSYYIIYVYGSLVVETEALSAIFEKYFKYDWISCIPSKLRLTFEYLSYPNSCQRFSSAHPLPVKSSPACNVEGQTYDEGDSMEVYNGDHKNGQCDQCTCANGKIDDCHFLFDCVMNDSSCNGYVKTSAQCCPKCQKGIT